MKRAKCRVFRSSNSFRDWSRSTVKKFNCAGLEKKKTVLVAEEHRYPGYVCVPAPKTAVTYTYHKSNQ